MLKSKMYTLVSDKLQSGLFVFDSSFFELPDEEKCSIVKEAIFDILPSLSDEIGYISTDFTRKAGFVAAFRFHGSIQTVDFGISPMVGYAQYLIC